MFETDFQSHQMKSFIASTVYPLMPRLRKGLFHRTHLNGFKGIRNCGRILPNDGSLPVSYPQSSIYYGFSRGYVCLFDFESAREKDYCANHQMWAHFFHDGKPITIILKLNRQKLAPKLIPNASRPKPGNVGYKPAIAYVEAWYPEPIPLSYVDGALVTCLSPERDLVFKEFSDLEEMWVSISSAEELGGAT
jgi:hypothetical protein